MRALFVVVGVCLGSLEACGYADPISQTRWGGVLALQGDEDLAMDEADKLMRAHCGAENYEVQRIDKVVVDEEEYVHTEHGENTTDTVAGTAEAYQIQVSYRCFQPRTPPY